MDHPGKFRYQWHFLKLVVRIVKVTLEGPRDLDGMVRDAPEGAEEAEAAGGGLAREPTIFQADEERGA